MYWSRKRALSNPSGVAYPLRLVTRLHQTRGSVLAVCLTAAFVVLPVAWIVAIALHLEAAHDLRPSTGAIRALLADDRTAATLGRSLAFASLTATATLGLGLAIAVALDARIPGWRYLRFAIFLPFLLPTASLAAAWRLGLDPYFGWANSILGHIHPALDRAWLGDPQTALAAVAATSVLQATGFSMAILFVALQQIPSDIHEAAMMDGARMIRRLRTITLPNLRPVIISVFAIQFAWGFLVFDQVKVMTNGGPGTSSEVVSTLIYHLAFRERQMGPAAAGSLIACVAMLPILFWHSRHSSTSFHDDAANAGRGSPRLPRGRLTSVAAWATSALLWLWTMAALAPVIVVIWGSLLSRKQLSSTAFGFSWDAASGNYARAWSGPNMGIHFAKYLQNSASVTAMALVLLMLAAVPAAYMEARRPRPGVMSKYFFVLLLVPGVLTWIPLFQIASALRSLSSPPFVAVVYAASGIPMVVVMLRATFARVPNELIESGRLDGASETRVFTDIVLPETAKAIAVVAAFAAIGFWNELGLATVLLLRPESQTMPVGISQFGGQYGADVGAQYAGITLSLLPIMLAVGILGVFRVSHPIPDSRRSRK